MKQVFVIAAIVLLNMTIAFAQPPGGRQFNSEEAIKQQTDQMVADLELNEKQAKEVEAINKKYGEKMSQAFQQASGNREQMRENMQKMRAEKDGELKKVLTADQFKKHQELEEQRAQQRRQGMGQGGNRPQGERGGQRGGN